MREGNQEKGAETVSEQSVLKRVKEGKTQKKMGKRTVFAVILGYYQVLRKEEFHGCGDGSLSGWSIQSDLE